MKVESIDKKYKCRDCNSVACFEVQADEEADSVYKICGKCISPELKGLT